MEKHSVNLIIKKEKESPIVTKLKIFLPVTASIGLIIFIISFFASLIYIDKNIRDFDSVKLQISKLEKQISDKKNLEGIYTLTHLRLKTLGQLNSNIKNYSNLVTEVLKLQSDGVKLTHTSINKNNSASISIVASSSASLDDAVTQLIQIDKDKIFTNMKTSGIVRDKNGRYIFEIFFIPSRKIID